jgi:transcriptional regulator with XRE-family HTH domain
MRNDLMPRYSVLSNGSKRRQGPRRKANASRKNAGPKPTKLEHFASFLGHAILFARLFRGLSQERLAEALTAKVGRLIRQTYISKIEKGEKLVAWKRLGVFCNVLQVRPAHIVDVAVSLAEAGYRPDDVELRTALAAYARSVAAKGNERVPIVGAVLKAVQKNHATRKVSTSRSS